MKTARPVLHNRDHRRGGADAINGRWHYVGETDEPAFENGWVNAGGTLGALRYALNDDELIITGAVTGGVTGTVVFTLPVSHRPEEDFYQVGVVTDGSDLSSIFVDASTGEVTLDTIVAGGGATYSDYTPTWTSTGTAPNIATNGATVVARYTQVGKLVHAWGQITFGSGGGFGTGTYSFALPVAAATSGTTAKMLGVAFLFDSNANANGTAQVRYATSTTCTMRIPSTYLGAGTAITETHPWTWATSDIISWVITYEAA